MHQWTCTSSISHLKQPIYSAFKWKIYFSSSVNLDLIVRWNVNVNLPIEGDSPVYRFACSSLARSSVSPLMAGKCTRHFIFITFDKGKYCHWTGETSFRCRKRKCQSRRLLVIDKQRTILLTWDTFAYMRFDSIRISSVVEKSFCFVRGRRQAEVILTFPFRICWWKLCLFRVCIRRQHQNIPITFEFMQNIRPSQPASNSFSSGIALFFPVISVSSDSSSSRRPYDCRAPLHVSLFPWGNLLTINRWNDMPFLFGESRLRFCCHSFI